MSNTNAVIHIKAVVGIRRARTTLPTDQFSARALSHAISASSPRVAVPLEWVNALRSFVLLTPIARLTLRLPQQNALFRRAAKTGPPQLLSPKETYEIYEKSGKGASFDSLQRARPVAYTAASHAATYPPAYELPTMVTECAFQRRSKKRIPFGVVIAAAVGIPLLIMICLFVAVWFQELGFI
ncbi:hypothetical protein Tcan_09756 [Toxocara canis]|uniref:Uncharacterized protein n=1 Tax=Toxocara canis TaxID=6265 RepID=A0A0B2VG13_TOXCA|nr:hypothetical protein Tcan_09756 [Toxocara canis]